MNQNLQKVLRVVKHRGIEGYTNNTELAQLSGLSRHTIIKSRSEIDGYLETAPRPSANDEKYVDNKLISTYLDIALTSGTTKRHFAQVMGAVAGFVLKAHTSVI